MSTYGRHKPNQSKAWIVGVILGLFVIAVLVWFFVIKEDDTPVKAAAAGGCKDGEEMVGEKCLVKCADGQVRVGEKCLVECADGQVRVGGVCGCADGEEMVGTKCLIKCTDGQIRVGEVCQVVPKYTLPRARYVRVERPELQAGYNVVNLGEIEVFDINGINIAKGAFATGGPGIAHEAGPYINLTDGDVSGLVDGNFAHTTGDGVSFLQVDLGAEREIAKVVITNRGHDANRNCCGNRLRYARMILLDAGGNRIKTTAVIDTTKSKIIYDFNVATPAWEYADKAGEVKQWLMQQRLKQRLMQQPLKWWK